MLGDRCRTDEADRPIAGLSSNVHRFLVAVHGVEDPSGSPASLSSRASSIDADGSFSLGLSTKVLPHANATGNIHGTIAGKLNGVMPATTPSGWRIEYVSTPVPTSRCIRPSEGANAGGEFDLEPRWTSPFASDSTFPCSLVMIAASFAWSRSISSRNRLRMRARRSGGAAAHPGNAAAAAPIARATSALLAKPTRRAALPDEGW
jgi:hypothetical protein